MWVPLKGRAKFIRRFATKQSFLTRLIAVEEKVPLNLFELDVDAFIPRRADVLDCMGDRF